MRAQVFATLIPLVVFWCVEEFWGLRAALIVGCIAAVLEMAWEKRSRGRVSFLTWSSNGLVLGLGYLSYVMDSGVAFKLQPMVMELATAGLMLFMRRRGGEPFLLRTFKEAPGIDAEKRRVLLLQPWFLDRLQTMDARLLLFLVVHGIAVGGAAVWGSTRLWILLKGVLFYVFMVLVFVPFMTPFRR